MAFSVHTDLKTPPDHTVIWRYMDLPKFLLMLEQKALYFATLSEFEDRWEAVIDRQTATTISTFSASGQMFETFESFAKTVGVNCWYQGDEESVAMWRLYTASDYGLAVRSTVGRLKKALAVSQERDVYLGPVTYRDYTVTHETLAPPSHLSALAPILQKRLCYKHECELRAVVYLTPDFPENPQLGQIFHFAHPTHGVCIPVDLSELIESVTTGPRFPSWANALLVSALQRAGVNPPLSKSAVFNAPQNHYIL